MKRRQMTTLQLPSFLHGSSSAIRRKAKTEGHRCAKQYQLNGSYPPPLEVHTVAPDEVVFTHEVVDFHEECPAWRLHEYWETLLRLSGTLGKSYRHINASHEPVVRKAAWGALFFAICGPAPDSAEGTAPRLEAVLHSWDSLQHGRYLHQKLNTFLDLEELMTATCDWAMDAWCPEGGDSVRSRLEAASERMARATREDCVEAILRQLPHILTFADKQNLNHPEVVTDLASWREHLATLDALEFERISGVRPGWVLQRLYLWDRLLDVH